MISLAQGGIAAAQYAGIKAGEKSQDRGVPGPFEEQDSRCDSLETWSPKVEEVRLKNGAIETRQWRIVDQEGPHWMFTRSMTAPQDGWEAKPGIDKLNFSPPLESQLKEDEPTFLAYAPNDADNVADSQAMTTMTEAFGPAVGTFQWRDKTYGFALAEKLPCFKTRK